MKFNLDSHYLEEMSTLTPEARTQVTAAAIIAFVHVTRRPGRSNTLMVFAVGPYTCAPLRPADKLPLASGRILLFRRLQAA